VNGRHSSWSVCEGSPGAFMMRAVIMVVAFALASDMLVMGLLVQMYKCCTFETLHLLLQDCKHKLLGS